MFTSTLSLLLALAILVRAQVRTIAYSERIFTQTADTVTIEARPITFKTETITVPATTFVESAYTTTIPPTSVTITRRPLQFAAAQYGLQIYQFASSVSSIDQGKVNSADSQLDSYFSALHTETPFIVQTATDNLLYAYQQNSINRDQYSTVLKHMLEPYTSTCTRDVAVALTSHSALSSEVLAYMPVARSFMASSLSVVGSIVSKELSLTGAMPSIASMAAAAVQATSSGGAASTTSSSKGMAVATSGIMMNAGVACAGMAVLAVL